MPGKLGDPSKTRFLVIKDQGKWRRFELAQPGCNISWHGDEFFSTWTDAYGSAYLNAVRDRVLADKYGTDRRSWPHSEQGGI